MAIDNTYKNYFDNNSYSNLPITVRAVEVFRDEPILLSALDSMTRRERLKIQRQQQAKKLDQKHQRQEQHSESDSSSSSDPTVTTSKQPMGTIFTKTNKRRSARLSRIPRATYHGMDDSKDYDIES